MNAIAPFSGHLYHIPNREDRLDFINRIYAYDMLKPDGKVAKSGKRKLGDRIMDMGHGYVLTTLSPARLRMHFPNIEQVSQERVTEGRAA